MRAEEGMKGSPQELTFDLTPKQFTVLEWKDLVIL